MNRISGHYARRNDSLPVTERCARVMTWNGFQIIMVIDPDCMFVNSMDIVVEEGAPIAQVYVII